MFRSIRLIPLGLFASLTALAACTPGPGDAASAPRACDAAARTVLLDEHLALWEPSQTFTIPVSGQVFVAVLSDSGYDTGGIFGSLNRIANVFVIEAGATPDVTVNENLGTRTSNDDRYAFDGFSEYRLIDRVPGEYRVYSHRTPVVQIISC